MKTKKMKTKKMKKEEVENRTEKRNNILAVQQIEALDCRLGVGVGAVKERTRLQKMI
jgi:hypothetical protein